MKKIENEVVIEEKKDTVTIFDTIYIEKPTPKDIKIVKDTIYIPSIGDSVEVDRETVTYEDSTYSVQISGIEPILEHIYVYPRETTIYDEKVVKIKEKGHFTHGIQVGVGYGMINNKPDFYVGYGFQYKF